VPGRRWNIVSSVRSFVLLDDDDDDDDVVVGSFVSYIIWTPPKEPIISMIRYDLSSLGYIDIDIYLLFYILSLSTRVSYPNAPAILSPPLPQSSDGRNHPARTTTSRNTRIAG
jgi:hypothetical protein